MSYNVIISDEAHNDIDSVLDYIINALKNPISAKNLLGKIEAVYATFPTIRLCMRTATTAVCKAMVTGK